MMANYPLRWGPVPASCHGDITRASLNTVSATGNHPDPELTGKAGQVGEALADTYLSGELENI